MSNLEALLLGVVQGLTEFLPISSSGHLIIVPWLQNYTFLTENEAFNKTFDVALHAGTLVAAIAFFRVEVWRLIVSFIAAVRKRAIETSEERLAVAIAIGTVPASLVVRAGAAKATPATPSTISATEPYSRRPGLSPSLVTPSQSSSTSPQARHGWTTVSGASSSATISSGHPTSPSTVAPSQRRFCTNRPSSETRSEWWCETPRTSSAWKAIETL